MESGTSSDEKLRDSMVLVDTSVWIDHFNFGDKDLEFLLNENEVAIHHFVIGELACGNFKNRKLILSLLNTLPLSREVSKDEFFLFLEIIHVNIKMFFELNKY